MRLDALRERVEPCGRGDRARHADGQFWVDDSDGRKHPRVAQ